MSSCSIAYGDKVRYIDVSEWISGVRLKRLPPIRLQPSGQRYVQPWSCCNDPGLLPTCRQNSLLGSSLNRIDVEYQKSKKGAQEET